MTDYDKKKLEAEKELFMELITGPMEAEKQKLAHLQVCAELELLDHLINYYGKYPNSKQTVRDLQDYRSRMVLMWHEMSTVQKQIEDLLPGEQKES